MFENRPTDGVHWHLIRCIGGQIIASAYAPFKMRKSTSPPTQTVCYLLRIIPCILFLMLLFHCRSQTPDLISLKYLEWMKYFLFASLATYILALIGSGWHVGSSLFTANRIGNGLYQFDSLASIAIGTTWMSVPKWLLHRQVAVPLDETHELCGRIMGSMFVASYIVATHALHWPNQGDRNLAVDCRVICCLSILSAQIWSQIAYPEAWSGNHWVGISLFSTWTVIAVLYKFSLWVSKAKTN
ncbi:hypothetical protein WR25_23245 [Diploscapter pachys]|uniref:Uncharacterized protein n=1 Tax=Diploscapter pachys TaxID=2018661 RepID=A0A2A2JI26_9BILA|nr:hypothetical protein WR25_23245 [Diploscapter pachys]